MKSDVIICSEDHISEAALNATRLALLPALTILVVVRGMILAHTIPIAVTAIETTINQDMKALFPKKGVTPEYFALLLRSVSSALFSTIEESGHGTRCLRLDLWRNILVGVPPEDEQQSIVRFVGDRSAHLDALIAKKQQMIELLHEKRHALISEAVTKGLSSDVLMKDSGIEWLAQIPAHWVVTSLKKVARKGYRTFLDGDWIEAPYVTNDGIRLIQTGNIGIGYYREKGFRFISEETFEELRCTEVHPCDVLICRLDGPVGRACLAPNLDCKMITSVDVTILKSDLNQDPRFLVYLLTFRPYLDWVGSLCRVGGGHRFRISRTMLGDFRVPLPPLSEQVEIADQLDREINDLDSLCTLIEGQAEKLREYRQTLIAAAVTGKIDLTGVLP